MLKERVGKREEKSSQQPRQFNLDGVRGGGKKEGGERKTKARFNKGERIPMGELLGKTCLYLDRGLPSPPPFISLRGEERGSTREKEEEENAWQNFVSANSFLSFPRFLGQTSKSCLARKSCHSPPPFPFTLSSFGYPMALGTRARRCCFV